MSPLVYIYGTAAAIRPAEEDDGFVLSVYSNGPLNPPVDVGTFPNKKDALGFLESLTEKREAS